ncbi:HalOD1 output domain-containing protein [Halostella salina]
MHDSVDTDALDSLFEDADRSTLLSFSYAGFDVSVSGEGRVVVAPTR